jgi:hypothetical protein
MMMTDHTSTIATPRRDTDNGDHDGISSNGSTITDDDGEIGKKTIVLSKEYQDAVQLKTFNLVDSRSDVEIACDKQSRKFSLPSGTLFDFFDDCGKKEGKTRTVKDIPPDYFEANAEISIEVCQQRCTHLNLPMSDSSVLDMAKEEIKTDRIKCFDKAINRLEILLIKLAEYYKIRVKGGGFGTNSKSLAEAFGNIDRESKAKVFWHVYYGVFGFYKNWQSRLEACLLHLMGWRYDPSMMVIRGKRHKCCLYKLSSYAINVLRKQLNSYGERNCGYKLTIYRPTSMITPKTKYEKRPVNVFMPYFLVKVSSFNMFLFYVLNYNLLFV